MQYFKYLYLIGYFFFLGHVFSQEPLESNDLIQSIITQNDFTPIQNFLEKDNDEIKTVLGNPDNAKQFGKQVLLWAEASRSEEHLFWANLCVAKISHLFSDKEGFIIHARKVFDSEYVLSTDLSYEVLSYLRLEYIEQSFYTEYLNTSKQFFKLYEKTLEAPMSEEQFLNYEVGLVNYKLSNFSKAIQAYKKNLDYVDDFHKSSVYNNIGLAFVKMNETDSSMFYFKKAIASIDKITSPEITEHYKQHFKNVVESNIADRFLETNTPEKAIPFYIKEINSARSLKGKQYDETNIIMSGFFNLAQVNYLLKKPKTSLAYIDSCVVIIEEKNYNSYKSKVLHLKAKNYLLLDDLKTANKYFKEYKTYKDSVRVAEIQHKYLTASVIYETKLKEDELKENQLKLAHEQKAVFFQKTISFISVFILVVLFIVALNIKRKNKTINQQKDALKSALNDKEVLLKEIHHRVKNNLQVISGILELEAAKSNNDTLTKSVSYSQQQIRSIALLHDLLYTDKDLAEIDMATYFSALVKEVLSVYANLQIDHQIQTNGIALPIEYANPLGLILTELLTNSAKHAFPLQKGEVCITLSKQQRENTYAFVYKDNGVGFNTEDSTKNKTSFGNKLIALLTEEMNAELKITSKKSEGVCYQIIFTNNSNEKSLHS